MTKQSEIRKFNPDIIRICREQMALSLEDAQRKLNIKTLADIEAGKREPTLNQVDRMSQLYLVPSWIFVRDSLPQQYDFGKTIPSFRRFKNSHGDSFSYKLRFITAKIENSRNLIISLKEEMKEPIPNFSPPQLLWDTGNITKVAASVRDWLGNPSGNLKFSEWRKKLEDKGIFIFVTGPMSGWSKVSPEEFRGLSIYYEKLPIIIINGSDTYKAKSFTLFHELGHLLMKKTKFDDSIGDSNLKEEQLCDQLSGEILMPTSQFKDFVNKEISPDKTIEMPHIEKIANKFKVSNYATLVKLKSIKLIGTQDYKKMVSFIVKNYNMAKKGDNNSRGIPRRMSQEVRTQYGQIYSDTILQAYINKHITLHKARNMFELKKADHLLKMVKAVA